MEIKVILLRNGTYLISQITEMELEPSCFLSDPMEIIDGELRIFPRYTKQRNVLLYSESLATLATPDPEILSKYKEVLPPDDEILQ
jgi:hypothetical protein